MYFVKEEKNKEKKRKNQKDDTITEYMSIVLLYTNSDRQTIDCN